MQASKRQFDRRVPINWIPTESHGSLLLVIGKVICMQQSNLCHGGCFLPAFFLLIENLSLSQNCEDVAYSACANVLVYVCVCMQSVHS